MKRARCTLAWLGVLAVAGCSVDKLPPTLVVHHVTSSQAQPKRVIVLPPECAQAWCRGEGALVAAQLAFRGIEVVDFEQLAARERVRTVIEIEQTSQTGTGSDQARQRTVSVVGPRLSDADLWTQRDALGQLGIDAIVRVRTTKLSTWPVRALALIRVTRSADASLVVSSACEAEVSRADSEAEMMDRALRCALAGIAR